MGLSSTRIASTMRCPKASGQTFRVPRAYMNVAGNARAFLDRRLPIGHAMDLGLQGKTAVITGGSKGIGFAIAEELAREGVDLHLAARSARDLKQAATDVECRFGVRVHDSFRGLVRSQHP